MPDAVMRLLTQFSRLMLGWSYEGSARLEHALTRVAGAYGHKADAAVLADSVTITMDSGHTAVVTARPDIPGLDQAAEIRELTDDIERGSLSAAGAEARLSQMAAMPPRFPAWARLAGLGLFSVGFSLSIQATWQELLAAAAGSVLLGVVVAATWSHPRLLNVAPLIASTAVSTMVLAVYGQGWLHGGPIQLMVPVLFFFIPGDVLTASILEMADGRITAGATRLSYGLWLLLQLAFGAAIATIVARVPADAIFDTTVTSTFPWWAVWIGWIGYTAGAMLVFSMRPKDFPWALAIVLLTFGTAQLGTAAFGELIGTFLAAAVMTLTILLISRTPGRPARYVLYLPAFFVLTPGTHGLRGLESWIGGQPIQGFHNIGEMISLLVAIALGIFLTATLAPRHWLYDTPIAATAGGLSTNRS